MSQLELIEEESGPSVDPGKSEFVHGEQFKLEWENESVGELMDYLKSELTQEEIDYFAEKLMKPHNWYKLQRIALEVGRDLAELNAVKVEGYVVENKHEREAWKQVSQNCKAIGDRVIEMMGDEDDE